MHLCCQSFIPASSLRILNITVLSGQFIFLLYITINSCLINYVLCNRENKLASIGFPIVYSPKRGFPPEPGAHLAIRTYAT